MNTSVNDTIGDIHEVTPRLIIFSFLTAGPLIIIGSFGNICVMIAFIRKRGLRKTSNYFTMGLMFSSLLFNVYAYPVQILMDLFFFTQQPACSLVGILLCYTAFQMVLCLLLLTIERYITIIQPFIANKMLTTKTAIISMVSIALYSLLGPVVVGSLTWMDKRDLWQQTRRCNLFFIMPSPMAILYAVIHPFILIPVMFVIYFHIFITVRRHIRTISAMQPATSTAEALTSDGVSSGQNEAKHNRPVNQPNHRLGDQRHTNGRIIQEAKSALRLFFVLVVYVINWVPLIALLVTGVASEDNISPYVYVLFHTFTYTSGVVAPYIYGFGNRMIRKEIKAMLCPWSVTTLTDDTGNTVHIVNTRRSEEE